MPQDAPGEAEPDLPAEQTIGRREQPFRQVDGDVTEDMKCGGRDHRQQHGAGRDSQLCPDDSRSKRDSHGFRQFDPVGRRKPDDLLCCAALNIEDECGHDRGTGRDKHHPQILHEGDKTGVGTMRLGHQHHGGRRACRGPPDSGRPRQDIGLGNQIAEQATGGDDGEHDGEEDRPVMRDGFQGLQIERAGDDAADQRMSHDIGHAMHGQPGTIGRHKDSGRHRPEQQGARDMAEKQRCRQNEGNHRQYGPACEAG